MFLGGRHVFPRKAAHRVRRHVVLFPELLEVALLVVLLDEARDPLEQRARGAPARVQRRGPRRRLLQILRRELAPPRLIHNSPSLASEYLYKAHFFKANRALASNGFSRQALLGIHLQIYFLVQTVFQNNSTR